MGLSFTINNQSDITFNVDPPSGVTAFQIQAAATSAAQDTVGNYNVDEFNNPGGPVLNNLLLGWPLQLASQSHTTTVPSKPPQLS
jgi:hypothetical protein